MCVLRKCVVGRTEGGRGDRGRENIPIPPRPIFTRKSGNGGGGGTTNDRLNSLFPRKKRGKNRAAKKEDDASFFPLLGFYAFSGEICVAVDCPLLWQNGGRPPLPYSLLSPCGSLPHTHASNVRRRKEEE